jgi:PAS domain S-box-containing protein
VLTSTTARDFGRVVDLKRLGPWPGAGRDRLGGFVAGRSLADLSVGAAGSTAPPGVGFIAITRQVTMGSGETLLLVALLNPDTLSNQQQLTLADRDSGALLTSYDGEVLATTASVGLAPGARLGAHPVFRDYLPAREHATYLGQGVRPEIQVVAFRASRSRPLVALYEYPHAAIQAHWWHAMQRFIVAAAAMLVFIAAMTATAWRSLRARESTRIELDRAQAEVAKRERELSVTVQSVQELIFRAAANGRITFVNRRWVGLGAHGPLDATGQRLWDLVVPAQRDAVARLFSRSDDARPRTLQATIVDARGAQRSFNLSVIPLQRNGELTGFAGSANDVTELEAAQRKLRAQLAMTGQLMEISPSPSSVTDVSRRYILVNKAWEDFTGRRREEVIGQLAGAHLSPQQRTLSEARDQLLLQTGEPQRYEDAYTHGDGSVRAVMVNKALLRDEEGRPAGILSAVVDVSEFRDAERATREARDAAEEASRAKTEFIANISHELRTPLQSILGFSELGIARGRAHERLASMFSEIHDSGQRMLALVNDLLDVSKIESTVGTFHLERTDLRPLVRTVVRELEPLMLGKQVRLEMNLSELPLLVKVDPTRLQQVVRNVLANAIKFSPARGVIDLSGVTTPGGEVLISVRDQGPGIPSDELDRVFEAFVQSSKTKDGSGGTGLGLAICRKILEVHGGRIHAENLPRGGTAFHIHLPARGAVETAPVPL